MIPVDLYPHQKKMNDECRELMLRGVKHVLMQGATGVGKSRMAAAQIQAAQIKGKRAAFVVPRRELVHQMSVQFSKFEIEHSFICAGYEFNPYGTVHICTAGSLLKRMNLIKPDVVFFDEVHISGEVLNKIIRYYQAQGAYTVGLSATPWKSSGKGLGCWFNEMVSGPQIRWLIDSKFLSEYRLFAPHTPDLSAIKTVAGEFAKGALNDKMEHDRFLIGNAVEHYRKHAMGRINLTFCVSRKHAQITNQAFLDAGVPSAYVDGETPDDERRKAFRALGMRQILNICSVELISTGFDLSAAADMDVTVESLSGLRPTQSMALNSQINGRALRKKDFPAFLFDHSGNCMRHGLPDAEREWTLADQSKSSRDNAEKTVAVRQCPKCDMCFSPAPICPSCNFVFPIQSREIDEIDGELQEITEIKLKLDKKKRRAACKTIEELVKFAEQENYASPRAWAAKFWTVREQYKRGGR